MEKYQVNSVDDITIELVMALINRYKTEEVPRLNRLYDYYLGDSDIKKRTMTDPVKPNNKIVNPFSSLITDTIVGYAGGKPINYVSEDKELMIKLQDVLDRNHEQSHNKLLWKQQTVMGVAYELLFTKSDGTVGIEDIDPREAFIIYDSTVEKNVLAGVRFIDIPDYIEGTKKELIYIYTEELVTVYKVIEEEAILEDEYIHVFGRVPLNQYINNDDLQGSFEKVLTLIDAYDLAVSDTQNNLEYFADAYLAITGAEFEDDSEVSTMKEDRVMLLPDGAKAEWLIKEASQEVEEFKVRLKEDIHQLSQIPNLSDESFSNSQSGEALKYKLFGLENLVSITEGFMREALEKRIQMIVNVFNVKGSNKYDYTEVSMVFTRNLPQNLTNLADVASKLVGIVSNETLYTLMPFIDDPAKEAQRFQNEGLGAEDEFHDEIVEALEDDGLLQVAE